MKKIIFACLCTCMGGFVQAQQTEGRVLYERTLQMQIHINDNAEIERMMPQSRTDRFELNFAGNRSIWKHVEDDNVPDEITGGGGGVQIKMIAPGMDDISFFDFNKGLKVEQKDFMGKQFLVSDSIRKLNWKLTDETKDILGHTCRKAVAQKIGKHSTMNIENGKMERKEVEDTSAIVAWFTTDIPVSAGPEVQGQLPGLILLLDMGDGKVVYQAKEISAQADVAAIKEPVKGKKVTPAGFNDERNKLMDEMQKNNQGGNRRVIIRN